METNTSNPFFTVIMPVYNRESFLKNSIESVINQSFTNFELICIDDGSTDKSYEIIYSYSIKDKRIKVIKQKNKGRCLARNIGIETALGKWICFLDSDDIYYPNHLLTLKNLIENNPEFYGFATNQKIHNKPKKYNLKRFKQSKYILHLEDFIYSNPIQLNQFCYNHETNYKLKFPQVDIPYSEDLLFLRQFCINNSILMINEITNEVIQHNARSMSNYKPKEFVKWNIMSMNYFINNFNLKKTIKDKIKSFTYLLCSNVLLNSNLKNEGKELLLKALKYKSSYTNLLLYKAIFKLMM